MSGAINVGGSLDTTTVPTPPWNNCAEWNAFWDAVPVDWVFEHDLPIIQFPLDMTNQAAITKPFMAKLAEQAAKGSRYSQLAYESYQLVDAESFYDMWDVVTTCWLANQSFFQPPTTMSLAIDATLNNTQGCIKPAECGLAVEVVLNYSATGQQAFYDYVAAQFDR